MNRNEYIADFTKERLLLGIFKTVSENNAMLKIVLENIIEMRNSLNFLEAYVDDDTTDEHTQKIREIKDRQAEITRQLFAETVVGEESQSMKKAFEWAWMNDPDTSIDPSDF